MRAKKQTIIFAIFLAALCPHARGSAITAGYLHTCAITPTFDLKCWGRNVSGELGIGSLTPSLQPTKVLIGKVLEATASTNHSCAIDNAFSAFCWGRNELGKLGDGTNIDRLTPTPVQGLVGLVTSISTKGLHTCAVADGVALCWGGNSIYGRLGNNSTETSFVPVHVLGIPESVTKVSAGPTSSCALTVTGRIFCWGQGNSGQLGYGGPGHRFTAVEVSSLGSGNKSISVGLSHACAITSASKVACWGDNDFGQIGDGTQGKRLLPSVRNTPADALEVSAGYFHTCARDALARIWCWGGNQYGQLGLGDTAQRLAPTLVPGAAGIASVTAGTEHTCAATGGGTVFCWGRNTEGQLGTGTEEDSLTPVRVDLGPYIFVDSFSD